MKIAIIGTAGRDKNQVHDGALWNRMCCKIMGVREMLRRDYPNEKIEWVSGGAAWADHLAVYIWYLNQTTDGLIVHMPAPWDGDRLTYNAMSKCGDVSNWYHQKFMRATGIDSLAELNYAGNHPMTVFTEAPPSNNLGAFFSRNTMVVNELTGPIDGMVAFTWGRDGVADGGTKDTWNKFNSTRKIHFSLHDL